MSDLFALLRQLGFWGSMLFVPVLIAYVNAHGAAEGAERLWIALNRRWVMVTWVVVALLAWGWAFLSIVTGGSYLRGSERWAWLPPALILIAAVAGAVALLAMKHWSRLRPWLTLLIAVAMCLSSTGARGAAPDASFAQGNKGEAIGFIQERLKSLGCYQADDLSRLTASEFDAPTANAVIRFQQANDLLAAERDLPHEGEVRREPEFRELANPWSDLKKCPP